MMIIKKTIYFIALLAIVSLTSCGGSEDDNYFQAPQKTNFRIVSIDYDKDTNDTIENKYSYEYDSRGNKTKVENTNYTDDSLSITTTNTFDDNGNLLTSTDKYTNKDQPPILHLRSYTYNKSNEKVSEKQEDFISNTYWIEKNGVRTSYNSAEEVISISEFTTDKQGNKRRELIDTNNDGKINKEINNTYNSNGKILTTIITDPRDITKPRLFQEVRTYDSNGNVLTITSSQFSNNSAQRVTKYQYIYDSDNNISTSTITYDSGNMDKKIYLWEKVIPIAYFGRDIKWAGTGCKAGSISVVGANTASLSILFDSYDAGKGSKSGLNRVACSFSVPIKIPTGYRISVFTADWEGYVEEKGELSRKYFLAGQPYTPWKKNNYDKPDGDNFTERDNINHDSLSSTCNGGSFNLRIDSQIKAIDENSYIAIDSTDLHNKVKLLLRFKSCQ